MATTSRSISQLGEMSSPEFQSCPVSRRMLLSAFNENAAISIDVVARTIFGAALVWAVGALLVIKPGLPFFGAFSAALSMVYLANLTDVKSTRDAIVSVVPTLLVWGILYYDAASAALIGVTLFTHLLLAFFAGFARVSGSLRDLALWPVLFGGVSVTLGAYTEWFLF